MIQTRKIQISICSNTSATNSGELQDNVELAISMTNWWFPMKELPTTYLHIQTLLATYLVVRDSGLRSTGSNLSNVTDDGLVTPSEVGIHTYCPFDQCHRVLMA